MRRPAVACAVGITAGIAAYDVLGSFRFLALTAVFLLFYLAIRCKKIEYKLKNINGEKETTFHQTGHRADKQERLIPGVSQSQEKERAAGAPLSAVITSFTAALLLFTLFFAAGGVRLGLSEGRGSVFSGFEDREITVSGRVLSQSVKSDGSRVYVVDASPEAAWENSASRPESGAEGAGSGEEVTASIGNEENKRSGAGKDGAGDGKIESDGFGKDGAGSGSVQVQAGAERGSEGEKLLITVKAEKSSEKTAKSSDDKIPAGAEPQSGSFTSSEKRAQNGQDGTVALSGRIATGWYVRVRGVIYEPAEAGNPKAFDYRRYLKSRGIKMTMYAEASGFCTQSPPSGVYALLSWLEKVKTAFSDAVSSRMSEQTSGLLLGIMFGDKGELDEMLYEDFQKNGIAHLLAVSGLHVSMIYGILELIFRRPSTLAGNLPAVAVLIMYAAVSGFAPSVVRAVFMICVHIVAKVSHRRYDFLSCISFCALVLLVWRPEYLFSAGFQLSFLAVLTISLVMPHVPGVEKMNTDGNTAGIMQRISGLLSKIKQQVAEIVLMQAGMMPISLYHFHYISIGAFFLNIPAIALAGFIVPAGTAIIPLAAVTNREIFPAMPGILDWLGETALSLLCQVEEFLLQILIHMNEFLAGTPLSYHYAASPPDAVFLFYYGALFFLSSEAAASWIGKIRRVGNVPGDRAKERTLAGNGRTCQKQGTERLPGGEVLRVLSANGKQGQKRMVKCSCDGEEPRLSAHKRLWRHIMENRRQYRRLISFLVVLAVISGIVGTYLQYDMLTADLVFVDVGQGDCAHLKAGGGIDLMFDSGGRESFDKEKEDDEYDVGTEILIPYFLANGVPDIDLAVISHLHQDHCGGLETMTAGVRVKKLLLSAVYRSQSAEISERFQIPKEDILFAAAGDVIKTGGVTLRVLAPARRTEEENRKILENSDDENELSLIVRAEYKGRSVLFTGDIDSDYEKALVDEYAGNRNQEDAGIAEGMPAASSLLRTDILKVAHHGSKYSSCDTFLSAVSPEVAVIQVGRNYYGHPSPDVLERLAAHNAHIFRNDENGAVLVRFGRHLSLKTVKKS